MNERNIQSPNEDHQRSVNSALNDGITESGKLMDV